MDYLRDGIHLRAMAQKDPLVEYRAEGHIMFEELGRTIREEVVLTLFHAQIEVEPQQLEPQPTNGTVEYQHEPPAGADAIAAAGGAATGSVATAFAPQTRGGAATATVTNDHKDVGRNDPCWCGSGKKFKKCHGA
jgi:preprotein translocase subunit SecA